MDYEIVSVNTKKTEMEGSLSIIEGMKDIPFAIKRIYYIYGAEKGIERGSHAHKTLRQFITCVYGKIRFVIDDGNMREEIYLDSADKGIYLEPGLWREMIWEENDSVLCVMASEYYDESDYIRDYQVFKEWKAGHEKRD